MLIAAVPEHCAEPADKAWLIAVGDVEHVSSEFGFDRYALDLDHPRPITAEERAGYCPLWRSVVTVRRIRVW